MTFPFKNTFAQLPESFFEKTTPTPVTNPTLIALNEQLAIDLGINLPDLKTPQGLAYLSGNQIPPGSDPLAMVYAGHQFGGFNPQLGDGRAILLGEADGRDIQLKGAGRTPYSRRGDGRSALGPVLREYLVSEAMHHLGIPTTRALAAVTTGENVQRETPEPGGIFTRVASSHLRIGTVQFFAAHRDLEGLAQLVYYTNQRHYPNSTTALTLLENVIEKQAHLIAHWMRVGFIHGVMNTDNMSLSGETIDYGPCAFMDHFNPAQKYSYIDQQSRYAYQNQPGIAQWNLTRLAEALLPLISDNEEESVRLAKAALEKFPHIYKAAHLHHFSQKIGLPDNKSPELIQELLDHLAHQQVDFTLAFRHLGERQTRFLDHFKDPAPLQKWLTQWQSQGTPDQDLMSQVNPAYIPRNHRVEEAIQAAYQNRDFTPFHKLHQILQNPYQSQPQNAAYQSPPTSDQIIPATYCGT